MSEPEFKPTPRHLLMVALIGVARALGWRVESTESSEWQVTLVLIAPLAGHNPERNRWPDEPEEGAEPTTGPDDIPGLLLDDNGQPENQRGPSDGA